MRRSLILLLLTAVLVGVGIWLFSWRTGDDAPADPWKAVPVNAALIIEVPSPLGTWTHFENTSQLWGAWENDAACVAVDRWLGRVREACEKDAVLRTELDRTVPLFIVSSAAEHVSTLLVWPVRKSDAMSARLVPLLGSKEVAALMRDGRTLLRPDTALPELEAAFRDGLLLITHGAGMMDDVLTYLDHPTANDPLLARARATLGASGDAHLLMHTQRAQRLVGSWLPPNVFGSFQSVEGWAALDVELRPQATLMSGMLLTDRSCAGLVASEHQTAAIPTAWRALPSTTAQVSIWSVNDAARFCEDLLGKPVNDSISAIYVPWMHGEVAIASARTPADSSGMHWAVLRSEDPTQAITALAAGCASGCDSLTYRGIRMVRGSDLSAVLGPTFADIVRPWWFALGDLIVFASDPAAARASIDAFVDGRSLAQESTSGAFLQQYAGEAGVTWWASASNSVVLLRDRMKADGARFMSQHAAQWSRTGACLVQLSVIRPGELQVTASIEHRGGSADARPISDGLWSVDIKAPITEGPFLVTDHLSRTKQILVQDREQRISLISCTGKIIWQREIDGPILGDVQQVDAFRNGKLQMLLNTASRVYLIDRNGQNVAGFPISLPEKASAPLSVFDYDNKRDYRILVPTVEARVLNYDIKGKTVQGWEPPRTPATCAVPVQHLRVGSKDHLLMIDAHGTPTVLDRRGQGRYSAKGTVRNMGTLIGLRAAMDIGGCAILWNDSAGNALSVTMNGAVDTLWKAPEETALLKHVGLQVTDLDADGTMDVVLWKNDVGAILSGARPLSRSMIVRDDGSASCIGDINLDGTKERITVYADGRVVVDRSK